MSWLALEVTVGAAQVEALSEALFEEGALSVDVADALAGTNLEIPIFREPGEDAERVFALNRVIALFDASVDTEAAYRRACASAGLEAAADRKIAPVAEQDWVRTTQSQFQPIQVSSRLWIVPTWHKAPDSGAINVVLDPGLAFGTGSHPTTRLCLDWLDRHLIPGQSVVDYGCGSGILAIAAARLGAGRVTGVDIDPQAITASRYNAGQNRVSATFVAADEALPAPADVVVANILSSPLRVLAPLLAELTVAEGKVVLSGILPPQAQDVLSAYAPWFEMESPALEDGWVRLAGTRRH
jgi:ribosomal protein L11 methyltransferase